MEVPFTNAVGGGLFWSWFEFPHGDGILYCSSAGWMNEDKDKDMSELCARDMSMGMNDLAERQRAMEAID